ncbi:MAG: hypothetical protein HQK54_16645 [Oligoflexales bacterium]|nr:hypothetical protein [Oligoflexales bacterium]
MTVLIISLFSYGCTKKINSGISSVGQGRMESYQKVSTGFENMEIETIFQLRVSNNSEQCLVPDFQGFKLRQCDGKSHWKLLYKSKTDNNIVRIQYRLSPMCLSGSGGNLTLTRKPPNGQVQDCGDGIYDIRFSDGALKEASSGKSLSYMKNGPALEIWTPVKSDLKVVDSWNIDLSYGTPFLHPGRKDEPGSYESDGWSHSNKRWLSDITVYASKDGNKIRGVTSHYTDGKTVTQNHVGGCVQEDQECKAIGTFTVDNPPDHTKKLDVNELLKLNFVTSVKVLYDDKYIVGLKITGNVSGEKTFMAPSQNPAGKKEFILASELNRADQIIYGFYGSIGQEGNNSANSYLKDLGVIAGSFETYSISWDEEWTQAGSETVLIRRNGQVVGPFGPIPAPSITDKGYFETVTATDAMKRHWIGTIELFSGGGEYYFDWHTSNCVIANDVVGIRINYSYEDSQGNKSEPVLTTGFIGYDDGSGPNKKQRIVFNNYEYISKIEYRTLHAEGDYNYEPDSEWGTYCYSMPKKGIAALRFTISNIMDASERVVSWDASVQNEARVIMKEKSYRRWELGFGPWTSMDNEKNQAIIGFYGLHGETKTEDWYATKFRKTLAIGAMGPILTTVGCAFRYKTFTTEEIAKIEAFGRIKFEDVKDSDGKVTGKVPSCASASGSP